MDALKKHRSHISGKGRWLKSKLVQKLVERGVKKLQKNNFRLYKIHTEREKRNHEETAVNGF